MDLTKATNNISFTGQAREGERKEAGVRGREEQEGRWADEAEEEQREQGGQRRGWWGAEQAARQAEEDT